MIKFSLPGFFENYPTLIQFYDYYKQHPDHFYDDRIIDSFYGADESLIWRGGRNIIAPYRNNLDKLFESRKDFPNVKIRHTFTNCLITEQILNDYLCNQFISKYIEPGDEVILNHPLLIQYFKEHYPTIPIIYSTTLDINDIDKINKITETNLYVINYNYNNDDEYLSKLKHPENVELICSEPCKENCPVRKNHYLTISKEILNISLNEDDLPGCPYICSQLTFYEIMQRKHAITNERLKELEKHGFQYYKISGRGIPPYLWIDTMLYYLAKPEYIDYIREVLL